MTLAIIGVGLVVIGVASFLALVLCGMAGRLDDYDERVNGIRRS